MKTIHIRNIKNIEKIEDLTLCLGFFDALHLGHLSLINKAKEVKGNVGVLSFSKNPQTLLSNTKHSIINTLEMKEEILSSLGVDYLIILELSWDILNLEYEDFISKILVKLGAKNIICGFDYSFGHFGKGKPKDLISCGFFNVYVIDEVVNARKEKISSSLIHKLIKEGNVEEANCYLSRNYEIRGKVEHGFGVGRTISFKTANILPCDNFELPSNGVYATIIIINDKSYLSMTNIGVHPTINKLEKPSIETYIFDFNEDIYCDSIRLIFYKKTREEFKFSSLVELKDQLIEDEKAIRLYFDSLGSR